MMMVMGDDCRDVDHDLSAIAPKKLEQAFRARGLEEEQLEGVHTPGWQGLNDTLWIFGGGKGGG